MGPCPNRRERGAGAILAHETPVNILASGQRRQGRHHEPAIQNLHDEVRRAAFGSGLALRRTLLREARASPQSYRAQLRRLSIAFATAHRVPASTAAIPPQNQPRDRLVGRGREERGILVACAGRYSLYGPISRHRRPRSTRSFPTGGTPWSTRSTNDFRATTSRLLLVCPSSVSTEKGGISMRELRWACFRTGRRT